MTEFLIEKPFKSYTKRIQEISSLTRSVSPSYFRLQSQTPIKSGPWLEGWIIGNKTGNDTHPTYPFRLPACRNTQDIFSFRVEECLDSGEACPLIPHGPKHYESKCLQKFTYQRMLVYDPYDKYLPFAVEGRCSAELEFP